MKKIICYIAILSIAIFLASCNQNDQTQKEDNEHVNETEQPAENNNNDTTNEENNDEATQEEEKNGVGENEQSTENDVTPTSEDKVYQNKIFKDVKVSEKDNQLVITGKAQVFEGVFDYAVYDGEEKLLEKNYQTVGAPSWGDFEIQIEKNLIANAKNEARFELFVYSAKDGSKENVLPIPLTTK
ncbi:Gmad2 immunoglobulin-like domain-containing protein [Bacillus timonensis]|uniref:Gmad2 immunoglobulin-like domain-containing protein n=1 Tax=Bacillus timonensis TaxID=1033734 RepID=UPI00028A1BA7|nr:Gmad2 immunoglobulin-like domain-containing protein [Bacillus timonensis]